MSDDMKEAAITWLTELRLELRNGNGGTRQAYFNGAADAFKDIGLLTGDERDAWVERAKSCPGHGDEGEPTRCAYGCELAEAS